MRAVAVCGPPSSRNAAAGPRLMVLLRFRPEDMVLEPSRDWPATCFKGGFRCVFPRVAEAWGAFMAVSSSGGEGDRSVRLESC